MQDFLSKIEELGVREKTRTEKKEIGQFFTSAASASFMANMVELSNETIKILDPGAGAGILAAAVTLRLLEKKEISDVQITFVETDPGVLPLLQKTIEMLKQKSEKRNVKLSTIVIFGNFITTNVGTDFDIVISNPPYLKIRKDSIESIAMSKYVYGQPNLYGLFMCRSLELLRDGGQYIFITPRSWTSGAYFQQVRSNLCADLNIEHLHIFESRNKAFSNNNVLQETMILSGIKSEAQKDYIQISISSDDTYNDLSLFPAPANIILPDKPDKPLLIPSSESDISVIESMSGLSDSFDSLGYAFKTGPVVEFRNANDISACESELAQIPMFRSSNIQETGFAFPVNNGKAQYVSERAAKLLLPNQNTVLVKRLSSKEEKRRLQSCPYYQDISAPYISVENHVNYLTRKDGAPLKREEVAWVQSILMSEQYDTFFRIVNGSTQVNAKDLNSLPVGRLSV